MWKIFVPSCKTWQNVGVDSLLPCEKFGYLVSECVVKECVSSK